MKAIKSTVQQIDLDYLGRKSQPSWSLAKRISRKVERARLAKDLHIQINAHFEQVIADKHERAQAVRAEVFKNLMNKAMRRSKPGLVKSTSIQASSYSNRLEFVQSVHLRTCMKNGGFSEKVISVRASCALEI